MKKTIILLFGLLLTSSIALSQSDTFNRLNFIIGNWTGAGSGFGNNTSTIESSFQVIMGGQYIEVQNESKFAPTEKNPEGEHHIDKGFISFDKSRKTFVFRQFNNEGYINQYVLNETLSNETILVFETEYIENFVPNGKAKWTIKKISENEIETIFDVSFGKEFTCFGTNNLKRIQ